MAGLSGVFPYEDNHPVWKEGWIIGFMPRPAPQAASTTDAQAEETEVVDDALDGQREPEPRIHEQSEGDCGRLSTTPYRVAVSYRQQAGRRPAFQAAEGRSSVGDKLS